VIPALLPQRREHRVPVEPSRAARVGERLRDAFLHPLEPADVDVGVRVGDELRDVGRALADAVLHVALGLAGHAREREIDVDEVLRELEERAEVGELLGRARAEEQHQAAALVERDAAAPALGHRAHRRRARAGADHQQVRARVVGHQEARAERPDHVHRVALREVAQVVRGDAAHRPPLVVLGDALHGERDVVVARALALARARDRVEARMVRSPLRVGAGRQDADRLALEHRERGLPEVEHDVADVGRRAFAGEPVVAADRRDGRPRGRVEVHVGVRGRPRRRRGAALAGGGDRDDALDLRRELARRGGAREVARRRQRVPPELLGDRVHLGPRDLAPAVDRAGGTRRDAQVAVVALARIDDVVARVVRDRVDRAGLLAGVAADADLRVDQVLADDLGGGGLGHGV